ncbi:MAG: protein kinase [Myxococcales bacterium]|nr:protein kinase [Myxococcales bacterium]
MARLLEVGEVVGDRFRVTGVLGRGGIGTTYAAVDSSTGSAVALKELWLWHGQDWKTLDLFQREARVLAELTHPAIPSYLAHFQVDTSEGALFYLAQSLAPGRSLAQWVQAGWRPSESEVRQLGDRLLGVIEYLHSLVPPVVHRDIRPENVLRDDSGALHLVDFGAVRDTYRSTAQGSTIVGTFGYMAPEQLHGQALPATDLFGLASTLVFLMTQSSPERIPRRKDRPDFRKQCQVSRGFGEWLDRALAPDPRRRFESTRAARVELARVDRSGRRVLRTALLGLGAAAVVVPLSVVGAIVASNRRATSSATSAPTYGLTAREAPQSAKGRLRFERQVTGHQGIVSVATFVAGGKQLATAASDGAVKVWDPGTGSARRAFAGHGSRIYSGDATSDGVTLYTSTKTEILGWRIETGERVATIPATPAGIASVRVAPDDKSLAIGLLDGGVSLTDLSGKEIRRLPRPGRSEAVAFSPDGKRVAAAGTHPEVSVFEVETGALLETLPGHQSTVGALSFSPDGKLLVTVSADRTARIWTFGLGKARLLRTEEGFSHDVWVGAFAPDGSKLVLGSRVGEVRVIDAFTGAVLDSFVFAGTMYTAAEFSRDGSVLALATGQAGVQLWSWREPGWRPPAVTAPVPPERPAIPRDLPAEARLTLEASSLIRSGERRSNTLEAKRLLDQALRENPKHAPAHAALAKVEQHMGYRSGFDFDPAALQRAHGHVDRALEIDPKLPEAHVRRGYLHLWAKEFTKAHASADAARAIRANDPEIHLLEMDIAHREGHPEQALLHGRAVIEGSDDAGLRFLAYRRLAGVFAAREEWDAAETCHVACTRLDPTSAWAQGNYAAFLVLRTRYDAAIEAANRAIEIRDYPAVHMSLADAHAGKAIALVEAKGDLAEAERLLDRARKEHAGRTLEHVGRGKLALARGDKARAKTEILAALGERPGDPTLKQLLDEASR